MDEPFIDIRPAKESDSKLIFEWANDPIVRKASFHSDIIEWKDHTQWFNAKILDPNHIFFIGYNANNEPIGQVRFAIEEKEACISVGVAPDFRGKGFGSKIIVEGVAKMLSQSNVNTIHAYAKTDNIGSAKAFLKAGFLEQPLTEMYGTNCLHFTYNR